VPVLPPEPSPDLVGVIEEIEAAVPFGGRGISNGGEPSSPTFSGSPVDRDNDVSRQAERCRRPGSGRQGDVVAEEVALPDSDVGYPERGSGVVGIHD